MAKKIVRVFLTEKHKAKCPDGDIWEFLAMKRPKNVEIIVFDFVKNERVVVPVKSVPVPPMVLIQGGSIPNNTK